MPDSIAAERDATIGICALTAFKTESPVKRPVEVKILLLNCSKDLILIRNLD